MFLTHTKTTFTSAVETTFDADYPVDDFREIRVSQEYPQKRNEIPSIWVDFEPIGVLRPVGIGHYEDVPVDGGFQRSTRWSYAGNVTFTIVAMTSLEADRLTDEMISVIAFREFDGQRGEFAESIRNSPLISMLVNYGEIEMRGFSAAPGTPWGTDQMLYERTLSIKMQGEFVNVPGGPVLLPISSWTLYAWVNLLEEDPSPPPNTGWIS